MKRVITLLTVQQAVRARVCARCPNRTSSAEQPTNRARTCELSCAPYRNLPRLWDLAVRTDPMVGRLVPALQRAMGELEPSATSARGRGRRDRAIAKTLQDLRGN